MALILIEALKRIEPSAIGGIIVENDIAKNPPFLICPRRNLQYSYSLIDIKDLAAETGAVDEDSLVEIISTAHNLFCTYNF